MSANDAAAGGGVMALTVSGCPPLGPEKRGRTQSRLNRSWSWPIAPRPGALSLSGC